MDGHLWHDDELDYAASNAAQRFDLDQDVRESVQVCGDPHRNPRSSPISRSSQPCRHITNVPEQHI